MNRSEIIKTYRGKILEEMTNCYRTVLNCNGQLQYGIYIWEDGEIETMEQPQGDNSWLQARDGEPRKLVYVATVASPCFDPWDYADHSAPDDPDEQEADREEIVEWLVGEYPETAGEIIDNRISDLEEE